MTQARTELRRTAGRRLVRRSSYWVLLALGLAGASIAQVTNTSEYLRRMDRDGDGRISLDEYLDWMKYAFDQRDRNHDGVLDASELPGGRGRPVTRTQHRAMLIERFHKQDADGDGYLSAKELLAPPR
jgi:Ca2+-binding EF-hand superfamily protein